jgi:hypothetical protein
MGPGLLVRYVYVEGSNNILFCNITASELQFHEEDENSQWLIWLCISLGVLFLLMVIVNICLCSAMTW